MIFGRTKIDTDKHDYKLEGDWENDVKGTRQNHFVISKEEGLQFFFTFQLPLSFLS